MATEGHATALLLLCAPPAGWSEEDAGVACGVADLVAGSCEPAGHGFHERCRAVLGLDAAVAEDASDEDAQAEADEDERMRKAWEERNAGRVVLEQQDENLYEVLGIGHLGFAASGGQIKKAYQKMILIHHPDKLSAEERKKAEQQQLDNKEEPMFLKVQRAFDTLSDPNKRRGYDSQFAFDDAIPSGNEPASDFFEVYGPVFERNERFSVKKPVPRLGVDETPMKQVTKFYQFWNRFESWRDFSKFDEFKDGDIENARDRMEKRWMMRQNEIQNSKRKKKEYERIRTLVERAMASDPRIAREKEAERLEKERKKRERQEKREAEERARREAEEALRREEEERIRVEKEKANLERAERQQTKKNFKRQFRFLKRCCEAATALVGEEPEGLALGLIVLQDWFNAAEDVEPLVSNFAEPGEKPGDGEGYVEPRTEETARKGLDAVMEAIAKVNATRDAEAQKEQELREERLREEQLKARHAKAKAERSWTADELSFLAKGVRKFPPGSRNRWVMIANFVNTLPDLAEPRSAEDCIAQSKQMASDAEKKKKLGTSQAAFEMHQKKLNKQVDSAEKPPAAPEGGDEWTPEQQSALEAALKEYPASMDKNERWKAIAKAVPGKKKKECVERFKVLRQLLLEKRNGAS